ncbi:MAG: TolB family protein [Brachybacterium sp.]|uniref:TolB family protein n=1 Tax=Brachybacterium sp. TaxID=1891286 RepID=UPI0026520503|nr:biopolymer transporter Tol [Brachybacterium sp.]MDN6329195.1 biopolymer transporter Tol [Brachybacterium sp.]MDN6400320.1 biopolymer transporter Tol [Brachybacterium sp.]
MPRSLAPDQCSRIHVLDVDSGEDRILHESSTLLFEAPNWTLDGAALIANADGHLFRLDLEGGEPQRIDLGDLAPVNNDHVLDPDGEHVYVSADDGHIHRAPLTGGTPVRITQDDGRLHFLHGVSPDGMTLLYTGVQRRADGSWIPPNLFAIPSAGGEPTQLTDDEHPDDGPEHSPDGSWIYFNSERARTGHAQLFRMRPDATGIEQLTSDERVNWFPHLSPDGARLVHISFPPGTQGHPEDLPVILRLSAPDGTGLRNLVHLDGGQGTINVNSWAPDSRRLAYVDYPIGA